MWNSESSTANTPNAHAAPTMTAAGGSTPRSASHAAVAIPGASALLGGLFQRWVNNQE